MSQIGFLLAGTGHIASRHADAIAGSTSRRLIGVLSRSIERASRLADRFGARASTEVHDALARDDVDAVAICTEHDRHVDLIRAAAEHGRHVLVEKPLAVRADHATRAAVAACESAGVTLGCVFQRRLEPTVVALRAELASGRLGPVVGVEASLAWRRDARYFESSPWRADPTRSGGGVVAMQAIHHLDLLRHLVGEVVEVTATMASDRRPVEDGAAVTLRFGQGAIGSLFATTAAARKRPNRVVVHTERCSISWIGDRDLERTDAPTSRWRRLLRRPARTRNETLFQLLYDDFEGAIRRGRAPISSGRDALRTQELVDAIYRAATTGTRVRLAESR